MDPEKGPYSEIEFQAISKALDDAYRAAKIALGDFLLAWLFLALGHRPTQYAALRVCDFLISTNSAGHITYSLNIPRAKQRGLKARSLFKTRLIIHNIGEKFVQHIAEVKTIAQSRGADPNNYPLFPALHKDTGAPRGYEWHQTATTLSQYLVVLFKQLKVHSERTGCPLRINPRRFRYSLGTRAAVEGYGLLIIAELLDHTDTQNAGIYIKAVPELIESFTPKLAIQLAPLANAFKGKIIADEKDASQGISPARRIFAAEHSNSMKPAGSCGVHGLCQIMEPLACYTCHAFRPWLHGPHSAILEKLTATREEILNSQNADKRIATINDLTILAVAEVVRQCREIKAQSKDI